MICNGFLDCHLKRLKLSGCNDCLKVTNESRPTVKENNVSYTIGNKSKITVLKYKVDNGLISGVDEIRCDYLMMFPDCMKSYYIELKSQGWKKALNQLSNTYRLLHKEIYEYTPHLRAVIKSNVPNTRYNQEMKTLKGIRSNYPKATLRVGSRFNDEV
ncbi:MAG: hypothetical protein LBC71_07670 [Oscillospiraceae bacterium]|jgi:hypothetical protein|nr:hypothetical protein [Oscillospiraceae bacterium]